MPQNVILIWKNFYTKCDFKFIIENLNKNICLVDHRYLKCLFIKSECQAYIFKGIPLISANLQKMKISIRGEQVDREIILTMGEETFFFKKKSHRHVDVNL